MHFGNFSFGSLQIDVRTYEHDVVIERGEIRKRKKRPSKKFRDEFGHTPRSFPGTRLERARPRRTVDPCSVRKAVCACVALHRDKFQTMCMTALICRDPALADTQFGRGLSQGSGPI